MLLMTPGGFKANLTQYVSAELSLHMVLVINDLGIRKILLYQCIV